MLGKRTTSKEQTNKTYLNIKDGAIVKKTPKGEESYSYVEGLLTAIRESDRTFRGEVVKYWYVELTDEETAETYSLGFPYASNVFKSIILQLASEDGIAAIKASSSIRIDVYSKNGYDKVQLWGEGVGLSWATKQLPPIENISVGGRVLKDDTKRMKLICSLANIVSRSIPNKR